MKAEYLQAIETKLRWQRWLEDGRARWPMPSNLADKFHPSYSAMKERTPQAQINSEARMYVDILRKAEVVYVGPKFVDIVSDAVPTMPEVTLVKEWLPSPYGFIYFGRELELPLIWAQVGDDPTVNSTEHMKIRAIGWVAGKKYQKPEEGFGIDANNFEDTDVMQAVAFQERGGQFWPLSWFNWETGVNMTDRIREYESNVEDQGAYVSWERHEIRYLAALLLLMHSKVFRGDRTIMDYDRPARRRAEKEGWKPPDTIRVITLRRAEYKDRHKEGVVEPVDWQCRWAVRGHWRQQWYPSLQAYIPKRILPYVKGPDDKPLKDPSRLFAVVR